MKLRNLIKEARGLPNAPKRSLRDLDLTSYEQQGIQAEIIVSFIEKLYKSFKEDGTYKVEHIIAIIDANMQHYRGVSNSYKNK